MTETESREVELRRVLQNLISCPKIISILDKNYNYRSNAGKILMSRLLVNNRWMHGIRLVGALYCRLCQRLQGRLRNCLVSRRHSRTIRQADRRSGQSDLFGFDACGRTLLGLGQVGCRRLLAGGRGRGGDGHSPRMGGGRVAGAIAAVDGYPA